MIRYVYYYEIPKEPSNGRWEVEIFEKYFNKIKKLVNSDYPHEKVTIFAGKYICNALSSLESFEIYSDEYKEYKPVEYVGCIENKFHIYNVKTFTTYTTAIIDDSFYIDFIGFENSSLFLKENN